MFLISYTNIIWMLFNGFPKYMQKDQHLDNVKSSLNSNVAMFDCSYYTQKLCQHNFGHHL